MMTARQIIGPYYEPDEQRPHVNLGFLFKPINIQQQWANNSLSANFLANYIVTLLNEQSDALTSKQLVEIEEMVSYVSNELLENSLKYSFKPSGYGFDIGLYLHHNHLKVYASNPVHRAELTTFQSWIDKLLAANPHQLQLEQIRYNIEQSAGSSRLGYLTLLTGFQATLAWKFTAIANSSEIVKVSTMVRLPI